MSKKSHWLKNYGFLARVYIVVIFFLLLNGLNIFVGLKEIIDQRESLPTGKYDSYVQGTVTGIYTSGSPEWNEFDNRRKQARQEIEEILAEIETKGDKYTRADYFRNLDRVMELEDQYKLQLMGGTVMPFEAVVQASRQAMLDDSPLTKDQESYIQKVQDKHALRSGLGPARPVPPINWWAVAVWIMKKYFLLMLFWLAIYLIRFGERDKSIRIFQRHHSELGRFIEDREPYAGQLSLKDEVLICPERFLLRVVLWPLYCLAYPHHECVAEALRFQRLKAHYLKYKPLGYQLSDREETLLLAQAKRRVKDFDKTVRLLFNFDSAVLVKRSVYIGYLSLVLGVVFQPAICLAASYSQKADVHFYGQDQTVLVEHQKDTGQQIRDGTDSMHQHDQTPNDWLLAEFRPLLVAPMGLMVRLADLILLKPQEIFFELDHVPLTGLLAAARC